MQKSLTAKQQVWFDHVAAAQCAGQSLSVYAQTHQLSLKALYNWSLNFSKRDRRESAQPVPFIKVLSPSKATSSIQAPIMISLPNGVRVQCETLTSDVLALLRAW